jgi:hypothetical protein
LLEFALQDSDNRLSEAATGDLMFRMMHRPLTQDEFSQLEAKLKAGLEPQAIAAAGFLSRCRHNDITQRAKAIVARYIAQINHPPPIGGDGSYLSSEAYWCNAYILCLCELDQARVRGILQDQLARTRDKRVTIWLTIASGMLGEEGVGEELCRIVESKSDASTRALALRAYALVAKQKAIPLLRRFINDRTPGGAGCHGVMNPLQIVARDELAELEGRRP